MTGLNAWEFKLSRTDVEFGISRWRIRFYKTMHTLVLQREKGVKKRERKEFLLTEKHKNLVIIN